MPQPGRVPHPREFNTQAEAVDGGAFFLLPVEVSALEERVNRLIARQKDLGVLLGEAMNESAETYHDNSPAEAANSGATLVIAEFNTIARVLRNAEQLSYPQTTHTVSIGNVVEVAYSPLDHERILVAGYTRSLDLSQLLPHPIDQVVSAPSPLGRALLGAQEGVEVTYTVGDREFKVGVMIISSLVQPQ